MIADLKDVIAQLKELSAVVNSFKSEAVQLRVIELVFSSVPANKSDDDSEEAGNMRRMAKSKRPRKRAAKALADETSSGSEKGAGGGRKSSRSGQRGGKTLIAGLVDEGFFKKPKTINKIIEHCDVNRATKYKQNELSGPLGRSVRDGTLKRQKNADGQYEYTSS